MKKNKMSLEMKNLLDMTVCYNDSASGMLEYVETHLESVTKCLRKNNVISTDEQIEYFDYIANPIETLNQFEKVNYSTTNEIYIEAYEAASRQKSLSTYYVKNVKTGEIKTFTSKQFALILTEYYFGVPDDLEKTFDEIIKIQPDFFNDAYSFFLTNDD